MPHNDEPTPAESRITDPDKLSANEVIKKMHALQEDMNVVLASSEDEMLATLIVPMDASINKMIKTLQEWMTASPETDEETEEPDSSTDETTTEEPPQE